MRILVLLLVLLATPALADVAGTASVIDGNTLEILGQRIRLHGIDAPESAQICRLDGKPWMCGKDAANALAEKISGRPVTCEDLGRDRYERIVARCTVAGEDLGEWLAANGWAVAYYLYSYEYSRAEQRARSARRGIWASEFEKPWEWRQRQRGKPANDSAPGDCRIKGNINREGARIYHVPGGRWYDRTKIDPSKGERWFCSEDEAQAAGWRKAPE